MLSFKTRLLQPILLIAAPEIFLWYKIELNIKIQIEIWKILSEDPRSRALSPNIKIYGNFVPPSDNGRPIRSKEKITSQGKDSHKRVPAPVPAIQPPCIQ